MEKGFYLDDDFLTGREACFLTICPCIQFIFSLLSLWFLTFLPSLDIYRGSVGSLITSYLKIPLDFFLPSFCFSKSYLVFSILYYRSYFFYMAALMISELKSLFSINFSNFYAGNSRRTHLADETLAV
jgi:hypothetical protein